MRATSSTSTAVRPPLVPMLAKLTRAIPTGDFAYEPKWDGFRTLAFREGTEIDLRSRADKRLTRYFPEVAAVLGALPEPRFVLDGEIVVVRDHALDFEALMGRLHPAASRVARLSHEAPAIFIAFDALAAGDDDLRHQPFHVRRARLEALLGDAPRDHLVLTPSTTDAAAAQRWLDGAGNGIDGVVAKARSLPYEAGKRTMLKVKNERTVDCVVAGIRVLRGPNSVSALLLGIHDEDDRLVHVGVVSQLTDARRRELAQQLAPRVVSLSGHPWEHGFGLARSPLGRLSGSAGRWEPGMRPDWLPITPLVAEVAYGIVDGRRFRHPARFVRWRPDREPLSCRFDQLGSSALDVGKELSA